MLVGDVVRRGQGAFAVLQDDDETLLGVSELDEPLEHRGEQPLWRRVAHHLAGELDQGLKVVDADPVGIGRF